ncbi:hypothetical protein [Riemerella columbipharyngis]|uniref:DoxX-like family protein n=1 Tax=Riemerella columbipharyngis TaxID=1071918 RepID=A0A1G7ACK7_9FLAO|nr:hypothetical protein [Riemerella columbipharyngis]SDE12644.1 hypothetical protein SAMN05421544_103129 [Riemerella columbipharyngis]
MENDNYFGKVEKTPLWIYTVAGVCFIFTLMHIGTTYDMYFQHKELNIPLWFFYVVYTLDAIMVVGLLLTAFYRKAGLFVFPAALLIHMFIHQFYLNTMLYQDITNLFVFIGVGLVIIIPEWKFFK